MRRRSVLLPTWRLWLLLLAALGTAAWLILPALHGWLAVREPVAGAKYAVVEGWAPDYVAQAAADWAEENDARLIFTTGIPLEAGSFLSELKSNAFICARTLEALGWDPQKIRPAPAENVRTERTRAMAQALKAVLEAENVPAAERKINIFTLGTHARRSRRIFREVLGSAAGPHGEPAAAWDVGIVSVPSRVYPEDEWYRHSEGAKSVVNELVALTTQSLGGK